MFGKMRNKGGLFARLRRHPITIGLLISGLVLPGTIGFAISDFIRTAKKKDDQAQTAALRGEAAQFAIAMKEDDGIPLTENPMVLGPQERTNQVISLKKPFFTYFLNRANSKTFDTANLTWAPPKACSVDFPFRSTPRTSGSSPASLIRTCFATVKNDPTGRYLYFALRYPTNTVVRHIAGEPLSASNAVRLEFSGAKTTKITLVYGVPSLAKERFPSQKTRFQKIHEISGYYADDTKGLIRSINGQAYEKSLEIGGRPSENYVTLLGRIDSSALLAAGEDVDVLAKMKIGMEIYDVESPGTKKLPPFKIPNSMTGEAAISLEKLYRTQIQSRAALDLYDINISKAKPIWQSRSLSPSEETRPSKLQRLSDWLANSLVRVFDLKREPDVAKQEVLGLPFYITLKEDKVSLPDIATRSLFFLTLALVIIVALEGLWLYGVFFVRRVIKTTYRFTLSPTSREALPVYRGKNEITILGRAMNLLIRKMRSRDDGLQRREKRERSKAQVREQHIKSRQRLLDAIGHEIRSPLQTMINKTTGDDLRVLQRMDRAVKALTDATTVEAGIRNNTVVITNGDLAEYLQKFCANMADEIGLSYHGKPSGVVARYDEINLEQVISHILENSRRFRVPETSIEVRLFENEDAVRLEIFNQGPHIEEGRLDSIFELGESTGDDGNFGQGLFVAQSHVVFGMMGSISAQNEENGVSIVIGLPKQAQHL